MFRKQYSGSYRLTISHGRFAQIRKSTGAWLVEIRISDTGELVRYAGLWPTLAEAKAEALSFIDNGGS